jgi:hypothetical protein
MLRNLTTTANRWTIANLVGFNLIWLGLMLFENYFIPFALILLMLHLRYQAEKNELRLIFLVATIGVLLDSALLSSGFFIFPNNQQIPLWLVTLWVCFAATIRHSLGFLASSTILQFVVGALFAPLSYLAATKFSVVSLTPSLGLSYLLLACLWGPLMVLIYFINAGLSGEGKCYAP